MCVRYMWCVCGGMCVVCVWGYVCVCVWYVCVWCGGDGCGVCVGGCGMSGVCVCERVCVCGVWGYVCGVCVVCMCV